jgi:hypothetical protein
MSVASDFEWALCVAEVDKDISVGKVYKIVSVYLDAPVPAIKFVDDRGKLRMRPIESLSVVKYVLSAREGEVSCL